MGDYEVNALDLGYRFIVFALFCGLGGELRLLRQAQSENARERERKSESITAVTVVTVTFSSLSFLLSLSLSLSSASLPLLSPLPRLARPNHRVNSAVYHSALGCGGAARAGKREREQTPSSLTITVFSLWV